MMKLRQCINYKINKYFKWESEQFRVSVLLVCPYRLHLLYGPLPAISLVRPLFPIKYFRFLQIYLHKIPPTILGSTSKYIFFCLNTEDTFCYSICSILFTWQIHFTLFIFIKDTKPTSANIFFNSLSYILVFYRHPFHSHNKFITILYVFLQIVCIFVALKIF